MCLLRVFYVGLIIGSDIINSGDEQVVGGGDLVDIVVVGDYDYFILGVGLYCYDILIFVIGGNEMWMCNVVVVVFIKI